MKILRTPDSRFDNLPGYPFQPHYIEVGDGLRMHYVEEGNPDGEVVLLLHGEPSWSYLYRKMIPIFEQVGYRVIVPDLMGFGKSDKPVERGAYTFATHLQWLTEFIEKLDLRNINLFCQDWGGLLGLRIICTHEERFLRVVAANTFLPTGEGKPSEVFLNWVNYSQNAPVLNIGKILDTSTVSELSEAVIAAYEAPFPDETYKAGARQFPALVPISTDDPEAANNKMAWKQLKQWEKPFLTLFSDSDPIMKGLETYFQKVIPGAQGQKHTIIKGGGHFLQEDKGEEIAGLMVDFMQGN